MGAYEDLVDYMRSLPEEERKKTERQISETCRKMDISHTAWSLARQGYLFEDVSAAYCCSTKTFENGEHYVYIWKHLNGEPFYVGSGKGGRSRSTSDNRPDRFFAELLAFDAILCYIAQGVSEKDARFIEHYASFALSKNGINLTNKDWNVFYMTEASKKRQQEAFAKEKSKTVIIDTRIEYLLSKWHS